MPQASADVNALRTYLATASNDPTVQDAANKLGVAADAIEAALPILASEAADQALAKVPAGGMFKGVTNAFVEGIIRKALAAHETPSEFLAKLMAEAQGNS